MHDLVRVFGRERAAAEETDRARRAALQRAFGGWLTLAEAADARLPTRTVAPLRGTADRWCPPAPTVVDPAGWFAAERAPLAAVIQQAAGLGMADLAWNLAAAVHGFYELHGIHDDAHATHQAALQAC